MRVFIEIENIISQLISTIDSIPGERKKLLNDFAEYVSGKPSEGSEINLTFICTHNSRRSHMSQIWAQTAAEYYGIKNVHCYSGGTEATAFNPRAVKAMQECGFSIDKRDETDNPVYHIKYSNDAEPLECFSKVYNDQYNPQRDFAAVMTCSDADANCPIVHGADARFPIRYDDPKEFDNTPLESQKYIERSRQIATEMLYAFSLIS